MNNIVDLIRHTADNQHELMMAVADHIEELEKKLAEYEKPKPTRRPRQRGMKPVVDPNE